MKTHEEYMHHALALAQQAADSQEVPIGAVVVDEEGNIIGTGYNKVESLLTQTAHAECEALRQAAEYKKDWRLEKCTLYVTLEPCSMCYSAAVLSRITTLVYGASSPLFGFHLDKDTFLSVYNNDALFVIKGILVAECGQLLKQFFQKKRREKVDEKRY